jgi:hypothetical protein
MASPFEDIFDRSATDWTQLTTRLDELADQYRVPRDLVRAVVKQESNWDINAVGDGGRARGWFQLHPGAAKDAGIDPNLRHDPYLNMLGGVRYVRQKLDQAGGDVDKALRLYNGGGDPNYVANVRRHLPQQRQQPGVLTRAASILSPASAEAATPTQGPPTSMWDDIFGPQTPTTAPAPPTAGSTPEQDAAYRASRGQQESGASIPTPPPPATQPGASQGPPGGDLLARFDALPAVQSWTPADRAARRREFAALRPELQEEFLASEEPPSQLTVNIEKASPPVVPRDPEARAAQIRSERADWERQQGRPWREGDPLMPTQRAAMAGATSEAPLEEGFTKPSTMIPLLMGGAGLKAATRVVPETLTRLARPVAEGLSQTLGWGTGRTIETGQVPSPGEIGTEAALNIAVGGAFEGLHAGVQQRLRRSQAGRAIVEADDATRLAHQQWQQEVAAVEQAAQTEHKALYDEAVIRAKVAQREYQMARQQRAQTIAAHQQTWEQAQQAKQAEYQGKVTQQAADVTAQGQALQTARAVPGRYAPETPSWVHYEKFGEAAKDAVVDLAPAKTALAEVRASRGLLPDGTARPFPQAVESIAGTLEKATGETSVQTIQQELRRLGPLTRSPNGDIRGPAKQLYGIYADALEASPAANDLLRQANATFRKEMALQDVSEWLRPGHGVVRVDNHGRQTINVGALLTKLEKTVGDDALFARSFAPDELQAMRQDFGQLAGTPRMPTRTLTAPRPGTPPSPPAEESLPGNIRVKQVPEPTVPGQPAPVTPRQALGERPPFAGPRAGTWGAILATMQAIGVSAPVVATMAGAGAVHVTQRQARWLLANALLDPKRRGLMQAALDGQMRLNPRIYGALVATLSPEEKKAYTRETRGPSRR